MSTENFVCIDFIVRIDFIFVRIDFIWNMMQPLMCKSPLIVIAFFVSRVLYASLVYNLFYILQFVPVNYYNLKNINKKKNVIGFSLQFGGHHLILFSQKQLFKWKGQNLKILEDPH